MHYEKCLNLCIAWPKLDGHIYIPVPHFQNTRETEKCFALTDYFGK